MYSEHFIIENQLLPADIIMVEKGQTNLFLLDPFMFYMGRHITTNEPMFLVKSKLIGATKILKGVAASEFIEVAKPIKVIRFKEKKDQRKLALKHILVAESISEYLTENKNSY